MKMPTSITGYIIAYGFAAWSVGNAITSALTNDPDKRAKERGYRLY